MNVKRKFNFTKTNNIFDKLDKARSKPMVMINIGSLLDIPTANFYVGKKGETIINGGLGHVVAFAGVGNSYKSTIMHYVTLSAASKVLQSNIPTAILTYDTENNSNTDRYDALASKHPDIPENPTKGMDAIWRVTSKAQIHGNDWALELNKILTEKRDDKSNRITIDFLKDMNTGKDLELIIPTFTEIDSFTEFEGEASFEVLNKDLDSSETKTFAMNQGMFKTKYTSVLPTLANTSNNYFLLSAHIGDKIDMNGNPYSPGPTKKLQYLKGDKHIKSVGSKFFFLTTQAWETSSVRQLVNSNTKGPEYPLDSDDGLKQEQNVVTLTLLRNKNGQSGAEIPIVVSQSEGVLPTLSEFYYIKQNKFGISGNDRSYYLDIYPDVTLTRTTIRRLINEDPLLRRAINITSEILQLREFHMGYLKEHGIVASMQEVYENIKKLGYDWKELLNTRGYWLYDQYENPVPYLSSIDVLKMNKGLYEPYFLKKSK